VGVSWTIISRNYGTECGLSSWYEQVSISIEVPDPEYVETYRLSILKADLCIARAGYQSAVKRVKVVGTV